MGVDADQLVAGEGSHLHLLAVQGVGGQLGGGVVIAPGILRGFGVPCAGDGGAAAAVLDAGNDVCIRAGLEGGLGAHIQNCLRDIGTGGLVPVADGVDAVIGEGSLQAGTSVEAVNVPSIVQTHHELFAGGSLREIYLPAFKAAVQEGGALTVMAAYNKFRGEFCAENNYLVCKILRNEWGFDGVYVTDWGAAHSTIPSMEAGLDLEMGTLIDKYEDWYYANPLIEAVKSGKIPMSLVDEKVGDVLRVMIKTNVLDPKKRFGPGSMNTKEHQQATYDAAAEAIVLLKNQNNLLPLDFSSIKSLAVIGDNATRKHSNGGLSSEIKAVYEVTPLEALRAKWGDKVDIRFAQGYEKLSTFVEGSNNGQSSGTFSSKTQESDALLKEAVEVARTSDVALLVCGLNHDYDTESFDRLNMDIPYGQVELIQEVVKANPRTIVVMIAGSPLNMAAVDICSPAIVWAWFNGMEGGNALVDVLSGKVNPSGKMPFTTPVSLDQSPAHALGNFPGRDLKVNYEEDILVGYRWFDTKGLPVVYPFGYGLSYTTFNYSNLNTDKKTYDQADTIQATFTLTNTGDREGAEVAQLYVSDPVCSVMRPVKELKGFKKVFLKPGESRRITLDIPVSSLAFYSEAQSQFVVEPGEFILQLGASTSDIKQKISIDVK